MELTGSLKYFSRGTDRARRERDKGATGEGTKEEKEGEGEGEGYRAQGIWHMYVLSPCTPCTRLLYKELGSS